MKKKSNVKKILMYVAGAAFVVAGFIVIPPLIDKYANKVYKVSLKKREIDFDDMGPEIIPNGKENET